jgi:hypothetical protein
MCIRIRIAYADRIRALKNIRECHVNRLIAADKSETVALMQRCIRSIDDEIKIHTDMMERIINVVKKAGPE